MENPEGVLNLLDEFAKLKSKEIPNDLEEYLLYVAASGDPVYQWSLIKSLYRQKLINVITEFYETCPMMDIPPCPNVDPFNYETMKNGLLDRLDAFSSAPFTIQRISELLTNPRKQYNRVDKFMRAIEKNIWVVSTREPGQREAPVTQENSSNLVNGVAPRVHVTVKHPKRGKSIEERIKSGHPQLIDDDDEEEEEEEQMEVENNVASIVNNETDDTPLQCTSVKDLIEKYENGTIFCNTEEKTEFDEKSASQIEESSSSTSNTAAAGSVTEDASEKEIVPTDSDNSSEPQEGEEDSEDSNLDKIIPTEPIVEIENVQPSEESKNENDDSKIDDDSTNEAETETETLPETEPIVENPKEESSFEAEAVESVEVYYEEEIRPEENSNAANDEQTSATEITEAENNESEQILEEVIFEVTGSEGEKEKEKEKAEKDVDDKIVENNETEVAEEKEADSVTEKIETEDSSKKLGTESRILLELESEWSSSPDDANLVPAKLTETTPEPDFVDTEVKERFFEKLKGEKESEESVAEEVGEPVKEIEPTSETCAEIPSQVTESSKPEIVEKPTEFTPIEAELDLQNEVLDTKMDENDLEEKSNDMIVEENDKIDEMEVDDSCTNSPMAEEEILEPMDDSDAGHS